MFSPYQNHKCPICSQIIWGKSDDAIAFCGGREYHDFWSEVIERTPEFNEYDPRSNKLFSSIVDRT